MNYFMLLPRCASFYFYMTLSTVIFLVQQTRRRFFLIRLITSVAFCILVMNHLHYAVIVTNRGMTVAGNAFIYASALLFMWPVVFFCFDITWSEACFCATAGYSAQFIHSIISEMLYRFHDVTGSSKDLLQLLLAAVIFSVLYAWGGRRLKKGQNFNVDRWQQLLLLVCVIVVEIVLCYNLRQQWIYALDADHMICDCLLLAICSMVVLIVQFSFLVQHDLSQELKIIRQMWRRDQEHFRISSETIELINRKCHDMRFQIRSIGKSANVVPDALHDMEKTISIYDALYQTGCRALDIILTEKSLLCQSKHITIVCVAEAALLNELRDADIYSLFGNILENAIHAVSHLPENERSIELSIRQHGDFLSICSRNPFDGHLVLQDGLPVTTSSNPDEHGFGVKSIHAIVQKYSGTVSFQAHEGVFNVSILFTRSALVEARSKDAARA